MFNFYLKINNYYILYFYKKFLKQIMIKKIFVLHICKYEKDF